MIRFSAALVAVAIGVLIGGIATSKLVLVYIAIVVSAAALVALAIGVVLSREQLFGQGQGLVPAGAGASPVPPAHSGDGWGQPRPDAGVAPPAKKRGASAVQDAAFGVTTPVVSPGAGSGNAGSPNGAQAKPVPPRPADASAAPAGSAPGGPDVTAGRPVQPGRGRQAESAPPWELPATSSPWSAPSDASRPPWAQPDQAKPAAQQPVSPRPSAKADSAAEPEPVRSSWFDRLGRTAPNAMLRSTSGWARAASSDATASKQAPAAGDQAKPDVTAKSASVAAAATVASPAPATAPVPAAGTAKDQVAAKDGGTSPPTAAVPDPVATDDATTALPAADDNDDDDWPTRYSWRDDEPGEDAARPEADESAPAAEFSEPSVGDATAPAAALAPPTVVTDVRGLAVDDGDSGPKPGTAALSDSAPSDSATGEAAGAADSETPATAQAAGPAGRLVTVVRGVPRYHDAECVLIRFLPEGDIQKLAIPDAKAAGCTPCAVCQPAG